jgi:hypothetical protein
MIAVKTLENYISLFSEKHTLIICSSLIRCIHPEFCIQTWTKQALCLQIALPENVEVTI